MCGVLYAVLELDLRERKHQISIQIFHCINISKHIEAGIIVL